MDATHKLYDCLILGGGIRGLSLAYYLKKSGKSVLLLEQKEALGGGMKTSYKEGFMIERGPRALKPTKLTLALVDELGLTKEIVWIGRKTRYILQEKGLVALGPRLLPRLLWPLCKEFFIRAEDRPEETVEAFSLRHFGPWMTANLLDPLTLGIYGGSIKRLSLDRCFPLFKQLERESGSLLRGFLRQKRSSYPPLFTFKRGMQTFTEGFIKALQGFYETNVAVINVEKRAHFHVETTKGTYEAKEVISTLPGEETRVSLDVVTLCYDKPLLRQKGFGFLVPSRFGLSLLGIVFDSELHGEVNTRLSLMMKPTNREAAIAAARRYVADILGIREEPRVIDYAYAKEAIPQYELGLKNVPPVGINACIEQAHDLVMQRQFDFSCIGPHQIAMAWRP